MFKYCTFFHNLNVGRLQASATQRLIQIACFLPSNSVGPLYRSTSLFDDIYAKVPVYIQNTVTQGDRQELHSWSYL